MKASNIDRKILNKLKNVPPCSVFISQGKSFVSKMIGLWWIITHLGKFDQGFSHVGIYWKRFGGKKHETVETKLAKTKFLKFNLSIGMVSSENFLHHFETDRIILMYHNKNIKPENLKLAYAYSQGSIGRPYDIPAFAKFIFPSLKQIEGFDICTENTSQTIRYWAKVPFVPGKKDYEIHPSDVYNYFESEQGKKDGWELVFKWAIDPILIQDIKF